ncbi:MAG TPA: hypothetical protein VK021_13570 [Flavobacteriaceae bacterium]|nr:hypothetical protein [Flavobacteriaceae bacterium]
MDNFYALSFYIGLCAIVGFIGNKKEIGFGWSFVLSLFITPIFGLILTLFSKKKDIDFTDVDNDDVGNQSSRGHIIIKIFGIFFIIGGILNLIRSFLYVSQNEVTIYTFVANIGILLMGVYFIKLANKKKAKQREKEKWVEENNS